MIISPLALLGPELKLFITAAAVVGPLSIILLLFFIKRIEKQNPERIRWR